jgi:hypothetical protein
MTFWPLGGPLVFGVCWGASLALLGRRLAHLARPGDAE